MSALTRRGFLQAAGACAAAGYASRLSAETPPNILLVVTDDQGYGDLGCHGNPHVRTPNLNRLHDESVRLTQFHAGPVCSPTRAGLMTGRYHYRTGVVDTYLGRSMMRPDEITLAETLAAQGYRTGIFGKWHLGDHYPMRAMDQGFQESLTHAGGGIGQPSDPPGGSQYQDPWLEHNGALKQFQGYCSDVYTDAAMAFIEASRTQPFFTYLAFNAPHTPLEIDAARVRPYLDMGLAEYTAKIYAMVENIDENMGRILAKLDVLGLRENTIVLFMTDNGPYWGTNGPERYNAGMRGQKGTVYEGGIRVPCFVRWPRALPAKKDCAEPAAVIDLMPTLLEACGAPPPERPLDGASLLPVLRGNTPGLPERALFFQWHRGDAPEPFRQSAVLMRGHKLVDGKELYDLRTDPAETRDIAAEHPDVVADLRARYEQWFADISRAGFEPVRIHLGAPRENPVLLTRQDWRGVTGNGDEHAGHWQVHVTRETQYTVQLEFKPLSTPGKVTLRLAGKEWTAFMTPGAESHQFDAMPWPKGDARLEAWTESGGTRQGIRYVHVRAL